MKNLMITIIVIGSFTSACGKQKAKQNIDSQEVIKLEEEIKSSEATLEKLSAEEQELDAINKELEGMLKEME